jgi:tRNA U54 and U55 pseudouridine synthase Pus10
MGYWRFTIHLNGEEDIPNCEMCRNALDKIDRCYDRRIQELHAWNLERHLNSQHSHYYVADVKK